MTEVGRGTSNIAYTLFDDSMLPLKFPIKVTSKEYK